MEHVEGVGTQILFVHDAGVADDEGLNAGDLVIGGSRRQCETANHGAADHEVHLAQRRRRTLSFQHLEVVAVIWLWLVLLAITLLQSLGDLFSHRAGPSAIGILPGEAVLFARRADDALGILVDLGIVVLFLGVFLLRFDETLADGDGIQLIGTDAPLQNFLQARLGVERPFILFLDDWNGQRKGILANRKNGLVRGLGIDFNRLLFLGLGDKRQRPFFIHHGIFGSNNVLTIRT